MGWWSEEGEVGLAGAAEDVVVDLDPGDATRLGEHLGLRFHDLGDEHTPHAAQQRVALDALEVAGELLDAVDLAAALYLDRYRVSVRVAA